MAKAAVTCKRIGHSPAKKQIATKFSDSEEKLRADCLTFFEGVKNASRSLSFRRREGKNQEH